MQQPASAPYYYPTPAPGPMPQPQPMQTTANINITIPQTPMPQPPPQPMQTPANFNITIPQMPMSGPDSMMTTCTSCKVNVSTKTDKELTNSGWIWAICMFFFGIWPCCLLPCFMSSCNSTTHKCPNCNAFIGRYSP
eukprot:GFUD01099663.1.p1 GENE.GFUD01099663.1~~GFUD01099663.1.p1  ORF type:complete len:153 (-),score=30.97 GFUD01099663.1:525-935(-)